MSEPLRREFSREEAIDEARGFMEERYGPMSGLASDERDAYFLKFGVLVDFVSTIIPTENTEVSHEVRHERN